MPQAAPQTFGRYRVIEPLGTGGMAQVFRGYDPVLDREIAIKVISHGEHDAAFNERFRREARAVAALRHPNIVHVYDYGEHDNSHYMVMELVHGRDLGACFSALYSQGQLIPPTHVQSIADQVAAGLDYAHSHHVIHRDVKPSNILLGDDGTVVLTDFGLVLKLDSGKEPTRGQSIGTPEYMAPEQAMDSAWATPRSDVYSLGMVLYLVLAGSLPFEPDAPLQTALKHIADTPRRPREINPSLPPAVEAVILKAIEREPAKRYATAGELAGALAAAWDEPPKVEEAKALPPVLTAPVEQPRPAATVPPSRRLPIASIVGGIVFVALVIAALLIGWPMARSAFVAAPPVILSPSATSTIAPTLPPTPVSLVAPTTTSTVNPTATPTTAPKTPTALPTNTATPTASATPSPTPTATGTATRVLRRPTRTPTPTPTEPAWVGPLQLSAYPVNQMCLGRKPRMWNTWVKIEAHGGNGVYTYYVDDQPVAGPMWGEYTYVLQVTDGSLYKAVKINVVSAGVTMGSPVSLWIESPAGC